MFDPVDELIQFLIRHDVEPWVTDNYGCAMRIEDWAENFAQETHSAHSEDAENSAERLGELRTMLDEKPGQKTISVTKVRAIIDPQ